MNFTEAVELARAGQEAGYQYLYNATYKSKYYLALQYMKNEDAAQDVIQDSYIRAFSKFDTLERPEAFSAWLGKIVANTAKNALAKRNPTLFSEMETGEQEEVFENQIVDERVSVQPELSYTRQETQLLVREMIDSLSDEQRICILMFHIEGISIREIAAVLGCSENTVKSRLNYARKNLKLKAEQLQKKGYKLFGLMPVPFLILLLKKQETVMAAEGAFAAASAVSAKQIFHRAGLELGGAALKTAAVAAAKTGISSIAAGKIIAGVVIAAVTGAGIGALSSKVQYDNRQDSALEASAPETEIVPETEASPGSTIVAEEMTVSEMEAEREPEPEENGENALEQYLAVIGQADSYDYGDAAGTPSGNYRYALVQLQPENPAPALLLGQENSMYFYHVRVFQYDPETDSVIQPPEALDDGVGNGGYRASLALEANGNGLQWVMIYGGTGDTEIRRVTLDGGTLSEETQWTGRMDQIPEEFSSVEIVWHDVNDTAALEEWSSGVSLPAESGEKIPSSSEPVPELTPSATVLPEGENRIVFTGTVRTCSYDEVVALQGSPDPNGQWADKSRTYDLIVLDKPQTMELKGADGYRSGEVTLINVSNADGISQYSGQHLTISIAPASTYWPSDTSLPVGQPSTQDVRVLE